MSRFKAQRNEAFFNQNTRAPQPVSLTAILREARSSGTLCITGKDLTHIPEDVFSDVLEDGEAFWEVSPLVKLDLSFNKITEMPAEIAMYSELKVVKLRGNNLTALPSVLFTECKMIKHLDVSQNSLTEIQPEIRALLDAREILLSENKLRSIPFDFNALETLQVLDLSRNVLTTLPECTLSQLVYLNVSENRLTNLPATLSRFTMLETFICKKNALQALPSFARLDKLKVIDAMENNIEIFPFLPASTEIRSISGSNLSILNLSYNRLRDMGDDVQNIVLQKRLNEIHVHNNNIKFIWPEIGSLEALKLLDVSNNDIPDVPYQLGFCRSLQNFLLDGNPIRMIRRNLVARQGVNNTEALKEYLRTRGPDPRPGSFTSSGGPGGEKESSGMEGGSSVAEDAILYKIRDIVEEGGTLKLSKLGYTSRVPSVVFQLLYESNTVLQLKHIDLSHNSITELPSELVDMPGGKFCSLDLSNNQLSKGLSADMCKVVWTPRSLTSLDLSSNGLTADQLDVSLQQLTDQLACLNISKNALEMLPRALDRMTALRELNVSYNRLKGFGAFDFSLLALLEVLYASNNTIASIVSSLFESNVRVLDLTNNSISDVPYQLGFVKSLETLELGGNPTRAIRQAVLAGGTHKLKEYLRNRAPV